jgi:hypothetical protein
MMAVAEGFEPSHGRINSAVPYQLGYATKTLVSSCEFRVSSFQKLKSLETRNQKLETAKPGCGDETRTRTPSFTRRVLSYPIELRRNFGGLGGNQTLTRSLQDFYALAYITSPKHFQLPICDCRFASWLSCAGHRISNGQLAIGNDLVAVGGVEPPTSRL